MKKEIEFIVWNKNEVWNKSIEKKGYSVREAYKGNRNFLIACIREMIFKLNFPFQSIWYNTRLKNFKGIFIVKDAMINGKFIKWLRMNNPDAQIIFWYWNNVSRAKVQPEELKKIECDVWSFNIQDCEKYDLKLNHTYYCEDYYKGRGEKTEKRLYDLFFIGKDKGRIDYIYELEKKYPNLKFYIHVTPSHFYLKWKDSRYKKKIPFEDVIKKELQSRAILEIVPEGSYGLTIRTMDALYLGKKLITNNRYVKNLDFYNENDFFILEEDGDLEEFINKPYIPIEQTILEKYSFEVWIDKFVKES